MRPNPQNLIPFVKGDPRINRKGRPKSFKQLRALVISIAAEPSEADEKMTRIESMIREMLKSDNPADRALALKYGWGNVPDELDLNQKSKETITVKIIKGVGMDEI